MRSRRTNAISELMARRWLVVWVSRSSAPIVGRTVHGEAAAAGLGRQREHRQEVLLMVEERGYPGPKDLGKDLGLMFSSRRASGRRLGDWTRAVWPRSRSS